MCVLGEGNIRIPRLNREKRPHPTLGTVVVGSLGGGQSNMRHFRSQPSVLMRDSLCATSTNLGDVGEKRKTISQPSGGRIFDQ